MIEKVNPKHPDKIADRIAGAIVDLAYTKEENPKIAVEVLIGHGECYIITESSVELYYQEVNAIVKRIAGDLVVKLNENKQDIHLANNQEKTIKCGDNGIFKGVPLSEEEKKMSAIARSLYNICQSDGKYILANNELVICHSNTKTEALEDYVRHFFNSFECEMITVNPLGDWSGGIDVDSGATNRKLGSDMAQSVTGGGLHGKDLSKADVSVNIYAFLKAQETGETVELCCAIGDEYIDGKPYCEIVDIARKYIAELGGFEKFAEWGLF